MKMENKDYHNYVTAAVSAKEAFEKINNVSKWWTGSFNGKSQTPGDTFSVSFGETFVDFKIDEVVPDRKIVWKVTDCNLHWIEDKKEWKNTKIVWDISGDGKSTKIDMTHVGLIPEAECYNDCKKGWNFYVGESLFKLLTENKGLPDQG